MRLRLQGTGLTAEQITEMIWQAQEHFEPCIPEAEQQQKRALEMHVMDILEVLAGMGCVHKNDGPQGYVLEHNRCCCYTDGQPPRHSSVLLKLAVWHMCSPQGY
jgi:hypothetical protein